MKEKTLFECLECGFQNPKYYGRCPQCSNWNSMIELKADRADTYVKAATTVPEKLTDIEKQQIKRTYTGLEEFDRVIGGGIVPGSAVLIGGEPGVGKSTLLLEISGLLAGKGEKILYYSGEESNLQIKMRAERLKIESNDIFILTFGTLDDLKNAIENIKPGFIIIDSIQTINPAKSSLISGSLSSMKFVTSEILEISKKNNSTVFIVGHITKEGQLAGPKTLEHMVDAVLYFQGELKSELRMLRAEKNRFGPVDEIAVFEMTTKGLISINDPSEIFIQHCQSSEPGIAIFPTVSGLRSIMIEIQALVVDSPFTGNPRRISLGFDNYRMSMLISIIEKKLKLPFYKSDVFLNITGGMMIKETAGDLALTAALISSHRNIRIPDNLIIIGEVGLTGEIRPVSFIENRLKESIRQGFNKFILPSAQSNIKKTKDVQYIPANNIYELNQIVQKKEKL